MTYFHKGDEALLLNIASYFGLYFVQDGPRLPFFFYYNDYYEKKYIDFDFNSLNFELFIKKEYLISFFQFLLFIYFLIISLAISSRFSLSGSSIVNISKSFSFK